MLGEDGRPMHKSAGNAIDFDEAAERMGVDVMRWLFVTARPEDNIVFGWHAADAARRELLVLWNAYAFFVTYARIARWTPERGIEEAVARGRERVVVGQAPTRLGGEPGRAREDPAVHRRPLGRPRRVRIRRPAGERRVRREERVGVPQDEQLAARLVSRVPAEQDVLLGPGVGVHPAHHVDAHPLGGLVELDRVAPALVHRPAVLAE
ncbi:MAG: hypothetical protein ACJ767_04210 [Chloroflexota bacterium]